MILRSLNIALSHVENVGVDRISVELLADQTEITSSHSVNTITRVCLWNGRINQDMTTKKCVANDKCQQISATKNVRKRVDQLRTVYCRSDDKNNVKVSLHETMTHQIASKR